VPDARLSVTLPMWFGRPASEMVDVAVAADDAGYDRLWVGEMVVFDGVALAGHVATATRRIPLVLGPWAVRVRSPIAFALALASIAALNDRPVDLALGSSSPRIVEDWHGRTWAGSPAAVRSTVAALRGLLAGERAGSFRLHLPTPETTITVAAHGPRMLRAGVDVADGIVANILTVEQARRFAGDVTAAAEEAGRPRPPLALWVPAAVDPTAAGIRQVADQLVAYLAPPGYGEMFTEAGFGDLVERARAGETPATLAGAIGEDVVAAVGAVGSAAEVADRIARLRTAGVSEIVLAPVTADDPGARRTLHALAAAR
jgi:probable F420-dependent oxidoreductase